MQIRIECDHRGIFYQIFQTVCPKKFEFNLTGEIQKKEIVPVECKEVNHGEDVLVFKDGLEIMVIEIKAKESIDKGLYNSDLHSSIKDGRLANEEQNFLQHNSAKWVDAVSNYPDDIYIAEGFANSKKYFGIIHFQAHKSVKAMCDTIVRRVRKAVEDKEPGFVPVLVTSENKSPIQGIAMFCNYVTPEMAKAVLQKWKTPCDFFTMLIHNKELVIQDLLLQGHRMAKKAMDDLREYYIYGLIRSPTKSTEYEG